MGDGGGVDVPRKKKARVTFEPEVEVRLLRDESRKEGKKSGKKKGGKDDAAGGGTGEKSTAVVREEVRRAIQRHVSGAESDAYERVKEVFMADPKKDAEERDIELPTHDSLRNHLLGLLSNVSALDRRCNELVNAVLGSEWLGRDESYVKLFVRFLGNLAAAQGGYLGPVLKMLVNGLAEGMQLPFSSSLGKFGELIITVFYSSKRSREASWIFCRPNF